ncbi:MAG TPA: LPS export ABC transporter permease LptG [Candidatus Sulfotelmatobacter sp.]|nr:LPS export ABC transporter permease LptG [Candidatus Sulfotelmatobacter sp.]
MRILDRYIAREFLKILGMALAVFVGIYIIVDLFEKLRSFLEAQVPAWVIVRYYLFSLPTILSQVMPVAVLLSSLLALGTMGRHNELLAMKMGHVGTSRIALPCVALALLLSGVGLALAQSVIPRASERAQDIMRTRVKKLPAIRLGRQNNIWYRARGDELHQQFLHIGLADAASGLLRDVTLIELTPEFTPVRRVDAREAVWDKNGWVLKDGYMWLFSPSGEILLDRFQRMPVGLAERPDEFTRVVRSPEEMSYDELKDHIERLAQSGVDVRRYWVDLDAKISLPFASVVMGLIGIAFGVRTGKTGVVVWVGACVPLGFLYWVLLSLGFSLGRSGALPSLAAAWLPNALFAAAGIVAFARVRH